MATLRSALPPPAALRRVVVVAGGRGPAGRVHRLVDGHRGALDRGRAPRSTGDHGRHRAGQLPAGHRPLPASSPVTTRTSCSLPTPCRRPWPRWAPGPPGSPRCSWRHPARSGRTSTSQSGLNTLAQQIASRDGDRQNDVRQGHVTIEIPVALWGQQDTQVEPPFLVAAGPLVRHRHAPGRLPLRPRLGPRPPINDWMADQTSDQFDAGGGAGPDHRGHAPGHDRRRRRSPRPGTSASTRPAPARPPSTCSTGGPRTPPP